MTINVTAPPSCVPPTDLAVALNSSDSATVSWTSGGTETAWEYVLQPQGTGAPTAAGTPTSSNPLTLSGLSPDTAMKFTYGRIVVLETLARGQGLLTFTRVIASLFLHLMMVKVSLKLFWLHLQIPRVGTNNL